MCTGKFVLLLVAGAGAGWISGDYTIGNSVREWDFRLAVDGGGRPVGQRGAADRWKVYKSHDDCRPNMLQHGTVCLARRATVPPTVVLAPCRANDSTQHWYIHPHALRTDWIQHGADCLAVRNVGDGVYSTATLAPGHIEQQFYFFP
uniref:Secreted protein n=1 Tax=Achlya hypogyna TaxID=1202772 RepID=A0A0A7CN04_ACHHY|nr:secreted protein [Achlya hypogyna]